MSNNKKAPAIRFKGFNDDWEERKLGEVGETYTGLSGKSKNDFGHGNGKFVTYMNVFSNPIANPIIVDPIEIDSRQNKVKAGDVFFTTSSETPEEVGMSSVWLENSDNTYLNSFCFGYRPLKKFDNYYFAYMLRSSSVRKDIVFLAQGISRYNISKNKVMEIDIPMPPLTEQTQIGKFFRTLDNLITLQKRRCDKLILLKKAMLEQMFPKGKKSIPEIRFKGFNDDWEQRKLGDMMNVTSVKRIHQSDWTSSGVRFLRARDIVAAYKNEEPSDYLYISEEKYNEYSSLSGKVKIGDLLVTGVGTIGVPMLINSEKPLYFKDGNIIWFQNENKINGDFFYYSFIGNSIQNFIQESAGTGTVGTYTIDSGKKTPIALPKDITEQQQIGSYFRNLDNLIALQKRKLEKLKIIKKSMLDKMFI